LINKRFKTNRKIRPKASAATLLLSLSLLLTACENSGPGDALWQRETAKQSTIGVSKPTPSISASDYASDYASNYTASSAAPATSASIADGSQASAPDVTEPASDAPAASQEESVSSLPTETVPETAPITEPATTEAEIDWTDREVKSKLTDEMYEAATQGLGSENTFRIANVIKKAMAGDPVTILALGQTNRISVGASTPERNTEFLLYEYWRETFPKSKLTIVRDAPSASDPYHAIHRVAQNLTLSPDLVLIDYATADTGNPDALLHLENLTRRFLDAETQPAVLFLYTACKMQRNDTDSQRTLSVRYRLPLISIYDAIDTGLTDQTFADSTEVFSEDGALTDEGHAIFAAVLQRYFNNIRASVRSSKVNTSYVIPAGSAEATRYAGSHIADNLNLRPSSKTGISKGSSSSPTYPNGWTATSAGFFITFKVTARNLGILYRAVPDASGADVDLFIDGNYVKTFSCKDPTLTSACDRSIELFGSTEKTRHTVTLRQNPGSTGCFFAVLALLVSGS